MAVFSQYNSDAPDLIVEVQEAKSNPLVVSRQYRVFSDTRYTDLLIADPEIATKPLEPYFKEMTTQMDFGTDYDYMPDKMSFELYGTHELWPLLLNLNGATHRGEFKGPTLKYISPLHIGALLSIFKFGVKRATEDNEVNIPQYTDLTVKKVFAK